MGEDIPAFQSEEEEVAFWDRTSLTAVSPDELEEIEVERAARPAKATFAIRLDQHIVEMLRRAAAAHAVGATQLARVWILDRLRLEREIGVLSDTPEDRTPDLELTLRKQVVPAILQSLTAQAGELLRESLETTIKEAHQRSENAAEQAARSTVAARAERARKRSIRVTRGEEVRVAKDVHVVPSEGGKWAVKSEGASRARSVHGTQKDAIEAGREAARNAKSELLIHGRNGQIRERDSYGNDPRSKKG